MPVYMDVKNVTVSAENLTATGAVALTFINNEPVYVDKTFEVVLFDDLNGNYTYDFGIDTYLGSELVYGIEPQGVLTLNINVSNSLSFPERAIFAFVDPAHDIIESKKGNNLIFSESFCDSKTQPDYRADWKWTSARFLLSLVPLNAFITEAYLEDTNGDGVIDNLDNPYVVFVSGDSLVAYNGVSGVKRFSVPHNSTLIESNPAVRDLDGDYIPEIIIDQKVFNVNGELKWDFSVAGLQGLKIDLNGDGITERVKEEGSCLYIVDGTTIDSVIYQNEFGCMADPVLYGKPLSAIDVVPSDTWVCRDISLSYPRVVLYQVETEIVVRVANTGNSVIPAGTPVYLYEGTTRLITGVTHGDLVANKYEDITLSGAFSLTAGVEYTVVVGQDLLGFEPYVEANENNNRLIITIVE
jgi:hypothetical protein